MSGGRGSDSGLVGGVLGGGAAEGVRREPARCLSIEVREDPRPDRLVGAEVLDVSTQVCKNTRVGPMLRGSANVRLKAAGGETVELIVDDFLLAPRGWRAADRTWLIYRD